MSANRVRKTGVLPDDAFYTPDTQVAVSNQVFYSKPAKEIPQPLGAVYHQPVPLQSYSLAAIPHKS
ncbi:hypothetical protein GCM10017044_00270 [Kordiimonas sediminis]|uniref:Uncharacterized protein n=1 Tax=Kordiimonas sediminis TaxID=1735581 RepID=A0A919E3W0_9PROT|nr:hypothetical protein GCM10017044_00270 [Kordiimonas sediminis]